MDEIAARAGVARSTASGVLNGQDKKLRISAETRQRVLEVAEEMGYRRNELARTIAVGKSFVLGFLKQENLEQEAQIMEGVLTEAADSGYLVKTMVRAKSGSVEDVARQCSAYRLAGLIVRRPPTHETESLCREIDANGIPRVFVDDYVHMPESYVISSDDALGMRLSVEHLLSLGHQEIAYFAGDSSHPQGLVRKNAFLDVMREHGMRVTPKWVHDARWDIDIAEQLVRQIFGDPGQKPTGVVCDGDAVGAGVLRSLANLGFHVPRDVSVVGYGGLVFTSYLNPPLTTIAQPFQEIGRAAVRVLLDRVEATGADSTRSLIGIQLLPPTLVIRSSTSPPGR
jgi:DNA-binding LacI/PurR family transcriptional regulator